MKLERDENLHEHPGFQALLAHVQEVPGDAPVFADWLRDHGADDEADAIQHADGVELSKSGKVVGVHDHKYVDDGDGDEEHVTTYDSYHPDHAVDLETGNWVQEAHYVNWPQDVTLANGTANFTTDGDIDHTVPVWSFKVGDDAGTHYRHKHWYTDKDHAINKAKDHADKEEIAHPDSINMGETESHIHRHGEDE